MTSPLRRVDFDVFTHTVCDALQDPDLSGEIHLVIAVHEPDGAGLIGLSDKDDVATLAKIDQMLADRPRAAAIGTRVLWSPDEGPSSPAWAMVAITPGRNATFLVKRMVEDDRWWKMRGDQMPWFLLSTAGGLRGALEHGKPMHLKQTVDGRLFRRPDEEPNPPVDEHGRI